MGFRSTLKKANRYLRRILGNHDFWKNLIPNFKNSFNFKDEPIIICGCPRSGTTLLMAILDSHPEIHVIPFETMLFQKITGRYSKNQRMNKAISRIFFWLVLFTSKIKPGAKRWAEKTPLNVLNLDQIIDHFSKDVKIINVIRDGRAVTSSNHQSLGQFVTPELWKKCIISGMNVSCPEVLFSLRYEDLVLSPESTLPDLSKFLDLGTPFKLDEIFSHSGINGEMKNQVTGKVGVSRVNPFWDKKSIKSWSNATTSKNLKVFLSDQEAVNLNLSLGYV